MRNQIDPSLSYVWPRAASFFTISTISGMWSVARG